MGSGSMNFLIPLALDTMDFFGSKLCR